MPMVCWMLASSFATAATFDAPRTLATAALPSAMIFLDMDGDGDADMAVAEKEPMGSATLELFENRGEGNLVARATVPLRSFNRLACGDFNQDGRLDLAQVSVVGMTQGELYTLLQSGPFNFEARATPLPFAAVQVYAGDLDGLSGADLVIPDDLAGRRVYTYLSNGQGFTFGGEYETEAAERDMNGDGIPELNLEVRIRECAIGDVNGDGRADVLVSNLLTRLDMPGYLVNVVTLMNLGDGRLGPWQVVLDPLQTPAMNVGAFEGSLALGDVDGDGDLDLAGLDLRDLMILPNNGLGKFAPAMHFALGALNRLPTRLILADADTDLDLDAALILPGMIAGDPTDPPTDRWALLRNNGLGVFGPAELYPAGAGIAQVALVNLDGFAGAEAVALAADDHRVSINDHRAGRLQAPRVISIHAPGSGTHGTTPLDMAVGDFNGDGWPDLAVTTSVHPLPSLARDAVAFLPGSGGGLDGTCVFLDVAGGVNRIVALPIAGSAATDAVVTHTGHTLAGRPDGLSLMLGGAANPPAASTFLAADNMPCDVTAVDLNTDGKRELAALRYGDFGGSARIMIVSVELDGSITALGDLVLGSDDPLAGDLRFPQVIACGDMNGDGRDDLVAITANAFRPSPAIISVILCQDNMTFGLWEFDACAGSAVDLLLADVTGDGRLDALVAWGADVTDLDRDGGLDVMAALGDGFARPVTYKTGSWPVRIAAGEFNGLPGLDLAVANDFSNELAVLLNDGHGAFPTQERYLTGGGTDGVAVADFDGDGWPDVAVLHDDDDLEAPIRHNASVTLLRGVNPVALPRPRILALQPAGQDIILRLDGLTPPAQYTVERSLDLNLPGWEPVATFPGTGGEWRIASPWPRAFYRVSGRR